MKKLKKKKKIGLALGGGVVLGAAHIGALKAIKELEIKVSFLTGTSIGALVAALFAFGKTWEDIKTIAEELDWFNISAISVSKYGLLSNEAIGKLIEKNLGKVKIENSGIPLAIIAADIATGEKVVLSKGNLADAVMASTCVPGVFSPVEFDGKLLVDGGMVENVPTVSLKEMGAEVIIGVDLNSERSHKKPENIVEVLLNTLDYTIINVTKLQTEDADFIIKPNLSEFNPLDIKQIPDLIEKGYKDSAEQLRKVV